MTEHRSLDEFATEAATTDDVPDPTDIDALVRTYRSTPSGTTCTACGQTVTTFWAHDGRLVCPECKEW